MMKTSLLRPDPPKKDQIRGVYLYFKESNQNQKKQFNKYEDMSCNWGHCK